MTAKSLVEWCQWWSQSALDMHKVTLVVTDFGLSNMHKNSILLEEIPPWCCIKNVKGDYVAWPNLSFMVIDKRISSAMLHKRCWVPSWWWWSCVVQIGDKEWEANWLGHGEARWPEIRDSMVALVLRIGSWPASGHNRERGRAVHWWWWSKYDNMPLLIQSV